VHVASKKKNHVHVVAVGVLKRVIYILIFFTSFSGNYTSRVLRDMLRGDYCGTKVTCYILFKKKILHAYCIKFCMHNRVLCDGLSNYMHGKECWFFKGGGSSRDFRRSILRPATVVLQIVGRCDCHRSGQYVRYKHPLHAFWISPCFLIGVATQKSTVTSASSRSTLNLVVTLSRRFLST
jgi:hypothetical protein